MDAYDNILRSFQPGVVITINEATEELTVASSSDSNTDVILSGFNDKTYQIKREDGDINYYEVTDSGLNFIDPVETLEIIGISS